MSRIPLADQFSLLRVAFMLLVIISSLFERWEFALVYLVAGWVTDILDGYLAQEFGSWRDKYPSLDMDGLADTALAFGSSLVVVIYGWHYYSLGIAWSLTGLFALTVISGVGMVLVMNQTVTTWTRRLIAVNMIVMHGGIQIFGTAAWFAYMTFGTPGVLITLAVAVPVVLLQRPKMQLWMAGKFA